MSAIGNIAVYDGQATPVLHTLLPVSVTRENGVVLAQWREALAGVPVYAQVRCDMKLQKLKSGVYRVERRVVVPVMESISGQNAAGYTAAPKVAHEVTDVKVGYFHERSSLSDRRSARQLGVNIDGNVTTSVAAATTGPLPELFDLLTAPV